MTFEDKLRCVLTGDKEKREAVIKVLKENGLLPLPEQVPSRKPQ